MLAGSLLLHLLLLALLFWSRPLPEVQPSPEADEVSMVFQDPQGSKPSTQSPNPSQTPSVAPGNQAAPVAPPVPENSAPSAPPPPPAVPTPATPEPTPPAPVTPPEPVAPAPPAPTPPPVPTQPVLAPQPEPPPKPAPPPSVSLSQEEEPALPPPPPFVPPVPPPPLPAQRPPPPRMAVRPPPRPPTAFPTPQNWSLNTSPNRLPSGRSSRGFDLAPPAQGGLNDAQMGYIAGAHPTGDWMGALRKWVDARKYYPEEAVAELQQGDVTVMLQIDRSGRVLSVELLSSSRSPFLDGAWKDVFQHQSVPPFPPDMTEPTTTLRATIHFVLRILR